VPLDPSKKTGLGSSAALIVSFVASTFEILGLLPEDKESKLRKIHIFSQILNAFVQEKVGSGFDIGCSVYGSQIYKRFTNVGQLTTLVSRLQDLFKGTQVDIKPALDDFVDTFDYLHVPYELNADPSKSFELCLIDVNSGSDTKLMVKLVLDWAKARQQKEDDMFSNELCAKLY